MKINHKFGIDVIRLLAACMVVAIHTYPFATINPTFDFLFTLVFCRIAVPIFLMITGYYVIQKSLQDHHYLIHYTKKIVVIYGLSILLYLPINLYGHQFQNVNILGILKMICIDGTFYHLWYFPALILGIWIVYGFIKKGKEPYIGILIVLLYFIGLFGDSYYGLIEATWLQSLYDVIFQIADYTRNGLFYVPIFLYIGYQSTKADWKLPVRMSAILFLICLILLEIEGYLLYDFGLQRHSSMYLMLIPTVIFLFWTIIGQKEYTNKKIRSIASILYIIHPLMIIMLRGIAKVLHREAWLVMNNFIHFVMVLVISLVGAFVIEKMISMIQKKYRLMKKQKNK